MFEALAQQLVNGVSAGMAYALVALGLTLVFGVLHIINFAHGELYMLGGLAAVLLVSMLGVPYIAAIALAAVAVGFVAWMIDKVAVAPVVRERDGQTMALLTTYAVSLLIFHSVFWTWGASPFRVDGIVGLIDLGPVVITEQRLLVIAVGLALFAAVEMVLKRTRFGFELRAMAQDAFGARAVGIRVDRVGSTTFIIAGSLAGIAGALLTPITLFSPLMGQHVIVKAFVVVVIGGMGSVTGAVVCGIGLGVLEALVGTLIPSGLSLALIYSLLVAALLVRPNGLFTSSR